MIIFAQADGTVQSILPSPVYQGSALSGSLYFVAPFAASNAVEVAFVRANGDVIGKYGLTRVTSGLPDVLDKLGTKYNVWEWQASNADVTAYAGEVTMQFRVIYAGQTLATASTVFTVQEGVIPQPVEPSADQWDTLIELYSRLNAKVPDVFLTDIAISEPDEDNIVTVTKYYNNGTTATEEFPAGGTSFSVKSEWVKVIDFTTSAWVNASSGSGYEIAFPPSQTGYSDNKFLTSLESTETGGYSTLADTVFKGSDGSVLISATEKYSGRLITLGGGIWGGVNVTAGAGEDSVQQVGGALANGKQSAAFGFETVANVDYEMVIGKHNTSRDDAQFQVGNGTDANNRNDAFVVYKDGRAEVDGAPASEKGVIRLADLGYEVDFPYGGPTEVRCDNTDGITVTGTMRIYVNQSKTIYHDVTNVSVEIPIFAGKNVTIDADETNKKAVVKASDIDVNTLIPLLLGSNGIKLTKNEAGDRLLIGISRLGFELGTFEATGDGIKFAYNDSIAEQIYLGASLGGAIDIYNSLVSIDNYIRVKATADEYIEINNEDVIYHTASGVKHYLREDTVKTIGGQSIYGTGDIPVGGGSVSLPIVFSAKSQGMSGSDGSIIDGTYTEGYPGAPMIKLKYLDYVNSISPINTVIQEQSSGHTHKLYLRGSGITYAFDDTDYAILREDNVKTLFGNQSIYGSGNIDLYNHTLIITATATSVPTLKALIMFTSSSNTKIDSLTDLYAACSKFGEIPASGYVAKAGKVCPIYSALCNSGDGIHFVEATLDDTTGLAWTAMTGITIVDTVTTV